MILTEYNEDLHIRSEKALSYQEGVEKGLEQGHAKGLKEGRRQGEARLKALYSRLLRDNRFDDLKEVTEDLELQEQLLEEYGIE